MEARHTALEQKLAVLLKQTAEAAAELQALEQGSGTPHYDQIEMPAHEIGQRLSQMTQSRRVGEVAAEQSAEINCPDCGRACRVGTNQRQVHSIDGPVELTETVAHCCRCRRSFFPSA